MLYRVYAQKLIHVKQDGTLVFDNEQNAFPMNIISKIHDGMSEEKQWENLNNLKRKCKFNKGNM